jgi:hypothetical protein
VIVRTSIRLLVAFAATAAMAIGAGAAGAQEEPVTGAGRYVSYSRPEGGTSIGPLDLQLDLFHPGGIGPGGVPCTVERTDISFNRVSLTFDFAAGTVTGSGRLQMWCEVHPGCGAVERVVEAEYGNGIYIPAAEAFVGEVLVRSLDGQSTTWGITGTGEGCAGTYITAGVERSGSWVLPLSAEVPATGYHGPIGVDLSHRSGIFELTLPDRLLAMGEQELAATFSGAGLLGSAGAGSEDGGEAGQGDGSDRDSATGLYLAIILVLGFGAGVALFVMIIRLLSGRSAEANRRREQGPAPFVTGEVDQTSAATVDQFPDEVHARPSVVQLRGEEKWGGHHVGVTTDSGDVIRLESGTLVTVLDRRGRQVKVRTVTKAERDVWVDAKYIEPIEPPAPDPPSPPPPLPP